MRFSDLSKWKNLSKAEKQRLKEIFDGHKYGNLLGKESISKKEVKKGKKTLQLLKKEEPLGADTPLTIPGAKFMDYRDGIWGDSYNWSWNRQLSQVQYLVIHHTVTSHDATPDDIALLHRARGWGGIGYHFVIVKDGTIYYVGDIGTARANVANMNEKVIGIAMVGDFTKHLPSDEQIISAHILTNFLVHNYPNLETIKSWDNLVGHKKLRATACPGSSWPVDMRERIINKVPYTPPPKPVPDYQTLYNQLKEEFEDYKKKVEPQVELYKWATTELNTNMEGFKQALSEIIRGDGIARDLFNVGLPLITETVDSLLFPDEVDKWKEKMEEVQKELEEYRKDEPPKPKPPEPEPPKPKKVLPEWIYKFVNWLRKILKLEGGGKNE